MKAAPALAWIGAGVGLLLLWVMAERHLPLLVGRRTSRVNEPAQQRVSPEGERPASLVAGESAVHAATRHSGDERLAVVRLMGERSVDGPCGTVSARAVEVWALFGLLAERRTTLLTRAAAETKLWPDALRGQDRFPNLVKEARAKLCDALGLPTARGRQVIEYARGTGYRLNPALVTCDVWLFEDAVRAAEGAADRESEFLASAVATYAGDYLDGLDHGWARRRRLMLRRDVVGLLGRLADLEADQLSALAYLERATAIDPAAEHLFQRRMEICADLGRWQEFHYCFEEIAEELRTRGRVPSAHTHELRRELIKSSGSVSASIISRLGSL